MTLKTLRWWSRIAPLISILLAFPAPPLIWAQTPAHVVETVIPARMPPIKTSEGVTAFIDVNVVPMDTERVLANQTVLVQGGQIAALGPVSKVQVPVGAVRIDGRGKYLIPGLGDMHVHINHLARSLADSNGSYAAAVADRLFLWLAQGITTVRNADYLAVGEYEPVKLSETNVLQLRARAAAGELWSPRIYTSGPWGPPYRGGPARGQRATTTPDSVAAYVAAYKAAGYDFLKIHDEDPVTFDSVAAAARRVGLPFAGHVPQTVSLARGLASGMRSIEHMSGYLWDRWTGDGPIPKDHHPAVPDHPDSLRTWAEATRRAGVWNASRFVPQGATARQERIYRLIRALHGAGAGLLIGTDEPALPVPHTIPGHGAPETIHKSLYGLVQAGLTPYQALEIGTRNVASFFGTLEKNGTIAIGKQADLVLLNGNPVADIANTSGPVGVMIGGRWLAGAEIDRRLAVIKAAVAAAP